MMRRERLRPRTLLVATFLIFFLPIVGAWLLNVFAPDWRPFGTVNHGTLVQPVRLLGAAGLATLGGGKMRADYLSGRWTLVHMLEGPCREDCSDLLTRTRQVHRALGDDMNRVQRLAVVADAAHARNLPMTAALSLAVADSDWLSSFFFTDSGSEPAFGIYLVDPQGYLMMRYAPDVDQRSLLADLERLLKISKIG